MIIKKVALTASLLLLAISAAAQSNCDSITEICGPVVSVPEPGTLLLLASGLVGLALARKRK